jgi:hypothetical protein
MFDEKRQKDKMAEERMALVAELNSYWELLPQPTNLLYNLFNKSRSERMWREDFPCPHRPRCPFGKNCCFSPDSGSLSPQSPTPERKKEEDEANLLADVYETIWQEICPCLPGPHCPYRTPTEEERHRQEDAKALKECELPFHAYLDLHGLTLCTGLCHHFHKQRFTHRKLCMVARSDVAHSLEELLSPFHSSKLKLYFLQRMINLCRVGTFLKPPKVPFELLRPEQVYCHQCGNRLSLRVTVKISLNGPSCQVSCCFCRKETLLDIYQ